MSSLSKVTVIEVRVGGEWGTFFVRESDVVPRADRKGFDASAEWTANTSYGVFGHYWGSMGQPFGDFIAGINTDYLLSKIGREECDSDKVVAELKRLIVEFRKEKRITTDVARNALEEITQLAACYEREPLCMQLYESAALSKVPIEWCDISTRSYTIHSRLFAQKMWPEFVKKYNEQGVRAESL